MNEHDSGWRRREHPHRHADKRFRSGPRYGGRGFGPESEGPEFGGPGFGGPGFGRVGFHGGPGGPGGPGAPGMPGEFGPWARGYRRRGGGRAKRGNVRAAALALLAEEPMNGYQIIQQISERSGGLWQPSPGSVYPALAQLDDEGLIALQDVAGGRRAYGLTEVGRTYVGEHADEVNAPWSALAGAASAAYDMRKLVHQVHLAATQVMSAGTDEQVAQARKVLTQARRALYRILAEDEPADTEAGGGTVADAEPGS